MFCNKVKQKKITLYDFLSRDEVLSVEAVETDADVSRSDSLLKEEEVIGIVPELYSNIMSHFKMN